MENQDHKLFDALKKRPDKEPDKIFSNQLRQHLQKGQSVKGKRFSFATILTIPVTIAVLAFLTMISTGQTLEIKSAAQLTIIQEKNLIFTGGLCLLIALLVFIIFVYSKGYTKGRLVYMTFSLSLVTWVGNLVYAENQRLVEPIVLPTYSDSFNFDNNQLLCTSETIMSSEETLQTVITGPYTMQQENNSFWKIDENGLLFTVLKDEKFAFTFVVKTPSYNKKVYDALLTIRNDRSENYEVLRMMPSTFRGRYDLMGEAQGNEKSL
ncbi:hypothetical protein FOH38_12100 [Lysinibacillus fusiformis]|nr:hypothetical protein FOH38_12100 [Lysinibacillus fusiformis]